LFLSKPIKGAGQAPNPAAEFPTIYVDFPVSLMTCNKHHNKDLRCFSLDSFISSFIVRGLSACVTAISSSVQYNNWSPETGPRARIFLPVVRWW